MKNLFTKSVCTLIFVVPVLFGAHGNTHAATTSYVSVEEYSSWLSGNSATYKRNIKKLDNTPVKAFSLPVLFGISLTQMTPNFGDSRGGGARSHEGLDFIAPEGVPVVSPTPAVVLKIGNGPSSGRVVHTTNPGGETFVYMHLATIADLEVGQLLNIGDLIGTVGDTGNAAGTPHLHLEVRKNGALDPFPRITKEFSLKEKLTYLERAFDVTAKPEDLAKFLASQYRGIFLLAEAEGIRIPGEIERELERNGKALSLDVMPVGLSIGDSGEDVVELQTVLIKMQAGPEAARLANTGATGYFDSLTQTALIEYQAAFNIPTDGIFTTATKNSMLSKNTASSSPLPSATVANATSPADAGEILALELVRQVQAIMQQIPTVVASDLAQGTEGAEVSLVQTYLIFNSNGDATVKLKLTGATGYFGPVTEAALREFQITKGIPATGIYDATTRIAMLL